MIGTKLIRKVIFLFSTHDTHSELCNAIRIVRGYRKEKWGYFLRAESFYNVATQEEMYADAEHPSAVYHEDVYKRQMLRRQVHFCRKAIIFQHRWRHRTRL